MVALRRSRTGISRRTNSVETVRIVRKRAAKTIAAKTGTNIADEAAQPEHVPIARSYLPRADLDDGHISPGLVAETLARNFGVLLGLQRSRAGVTMVQRQDLMGLGAGVDTIGASGRHRGSDAVYS